MTRSIHIDRRLLELESLLRNGRPKSKLELACLQRQMDDLLHGHERGLVWDEDEARRCIQFCGLVKHWKGAKAGQPFVPEPWQEHMVIAPLMGWYVGETRARGGDRRFQTGYIEIPRKAGKTFMASVLANQGLIADREQGAEVYAAATKRDQAMILFKDARLTLGKELRRLVTALKGSITCPALNSTFTPLSSDYNSLDGLNIHRAVIDELHAHKTRDLWDVLLTATGARKNPMILAITTAGFDRSSICWEQHTICENILNGVKGNDSYFAFIAKAEDTDDWKDPQTWSRANPNLNVSIFERNVRSLMEQASETPSAENNFRRKYLNQWTQQSIRWLQMSTWDGCQRDFSLDDMRGERCYAAIDLASTRDVNSMVLMFPREDGVYVYPIFWVPEDAKDDRGRQDRTQVLNWAGKTWKGQPLIRKTPGNTTDYATIAEDVMELDREFHFETLAYDPWSPAIPFVQSLQTLGFEADRLQEFRQSIMNFNAPTKEFHRLLISRRLVHDGNPVLRWMAENVAIREDSSGNIRPDKAKSADKIDGIVCVIMDVGLWITSDGDREVVYTAGSMFQ